MSKIPNIPIPLSKTTIAGEDIYCCSDPIMELHHSEWTDRQSKRFESDKMSLILHPSERKSLLVASGPYKMRYVPQRIRLIKKIAWFVRGDRREIKKLLKPIIAIGHLRNIGYGRISEWEYEETEENMSIFVLHKGKKVLMKTVPIECATNACGYRRSFCGTASPYWHPDNFREAAIPC